MEEEVAWARSLTPEERLAVVASLCRSGAAMLLAHPKRELVLALRDPVPASTIAALRRLRIAR